MADLRKYFLCCVLMWCLLVQPDSLCAQEQPDPKPFKLKMALTPFLSQAPFFIAQEKNYFFEQGIQVDFVRMNRAHEAIPALMQGLLDVVPGTINVTLLNALAREAKIKVVANIGSMDANGCIYLSLVVRRKIIDEGELKNLKGLRGRRVATNFVSAKAYFLEKLLHTAALTSDDIEIVDMPDVLMSDALKNKAVDAATLSEPWLTRTLQAGHGISWVPAHNIIPNFQYMFVLYGPTLLQKNPEGGRRFMTAFLKALRTFQQGKTEQNLSILAKYTGLDENILQQACWLPSRNDGRVHIQSILDFQTWAIKKRYLDRAVSPDQFWDPNYIEYANKALGASIR